MNAIKKMALTSVVSAVVLLAGCKDKEGPPTEPNAQDTQQDQNLPAQEQSAPSPALERPIAHTDILAHLRPHER